VESVCTELFNVPSWVIFKLRIFVFICIVLFLYRLEGLALMSQINAFRRVSGSETCLSVCIYTAQRQTALEYKGVGRTKLSNRFLLHSHI
jgi:hypothetical protein